MTYNPSFLCPDCGWQGDDPNCPYCNIATERIDGLEQVDDEEKYPASMMEDNDDLDDLSSLSLGSDY